MGAKLPKKLLEPPPRHLSDLKPGESAYIWHCHLTVSKKRDCYLSPNAVVSATPGGESIRVDRRKDGYHVVLISEGLTWQPDKIIESSLIPVLSVHEDYDPRLKSINEMSKEARKRLGRSELGRRTEKQRPTSSA